MEVPVTNVLIASFLSSKLPYVHRDPKDYYGWGAQDGHLSFHTAPELSTNSLFTVGLFSVMQIERKGVYVRVFHDLELLRYVLCCAIERQL